MTIIRENFPNPYVWEAMQSATHSTWCCSVVSGMVVTSQPAELGRRTSRGLMWYLAYDICILAIFFPFLFFFFSSGDVNKQRHGTQATLWFSISLNCVISVYNSLPGMFWERNGSNKIWICHLQHEILTQTHPDLTKLTDMSWGLGTIGETGMYLSIRYAALISSDKISL